MHLQKKLIISDGNPIGKINNLTVLEGLQKPDDTTIFCQPTIKKILSEMEFLPEIKTHRQNLFLCRSILDGICLLVA
jgi:hypothetical protein